MTKKELRREITDFLNNKGIDYDNSQNTIKVYQTAVKHGFKPVEGTVYENDKIIGFNEPAPELAPEPIEPPENLESYPRAEQATDPEPDPDQDPDQEPEPVELDEPEPEPRKKQKTVKHPATPPAPVLINKPAPDESLLWLLIAAALIIGIMYFKNIQKRDYEQAA